MYNIHMYITYICVYSSKNFIPVSRDEQKAAPVEILTALPLTELLLVLMIL